MPSCAPHPQECPDPSSKAPAKACWDQESMATIFPRPGGPQPAAPRLVECWDRPPIPDHETLPWLAWAQATLPSPSYHPAASLPVGEPPSARSAPPSQGHHGVSPRLPQSEWGWAKGWEEGPAAQWELWPLPGWALLPK